MLEALLSGAAEGLLLIQGEGLRRGAEGPPRGSPPRPGPASPPRLLRRGAPFMGQLEGREGGRVFFWPKYERGLLPASSLELWDLLVASHPSCAAAYRMQGGGCLLVALPSLL